MRGRIRWPAAPALGFIAFMVGGPMVVMAWYSLRERGPGGVGVGDGMTSDAYKRLFVAEDFSGNVAFDATYLQIMWSSVLLALLTMLIALAIGFPTAVWIANRPRRLQPLLILAVTIPFWTSMLVRTYAWIVVLRETGPLASALDAVGIDAPKMLNTRGATLVGLAYTFLPFMVLPIYVAVERFDHRIAEAGFDLGATPAVVLRRIVWPSARSGVVAGCLLVSIPAIGAFLQPELLGGGRSLMVANLIQQQFGASRNWPLGSALAMLLLVLVGAVLVVTRRAARGAKVVLS